MTQSTANAEENRGWIERVFARLGHARRMLVIVSVVLLVLLIADLVSVVGAVIVELALIVGISLSSRPAMSRQPSSVSQKSVASGLLPGTLRLADSLPNPCFILTEDGSVRYANDRAIGLFGIVVGEVLTYRLRYPGLVAAFGRVTKGEGPQQVQFEERVPTERTFSAWFASLRGAGDGNNYVLVLDDLTEARATERMRVDFVANASHELRTPLASLSGFVETLQGPARNDAEARDRFLAMMHDQALRMSRLIDDLLSLSRVEMRAHVRPNDQVDLIALVRHVIDTMTPLAAEMGVRIEAELPDHKITIAGDRDELVQVFNNLVENACKYGQAGERVVVRITGGEEGGPCSVVVKDFGPGIAPEHVPRLTERFYRVDADESRRHRGTGLGLAIVKHIVSRHRARLQVESIPGRGAQFAVHFSASRAPSPVEA